MAFSVAWRSISWANRCACVQQSRQPCFSLQIIAPAARAHSRGMRCKRCVQICSPFLLQVLQDQKVYVFLLHWACLLQLLPLVLVLLLVLLPCPYCCSPLSASSSCRCLSATSLHQQSTSELLFCIYTHLTVAFWVQLNTNRNVPGVAFAGKLEQAGNVVKHTGQMKTDAICPSHRFFRVSSGVTTKSPCCSTCFEAVLHHALHVLCIARLLLNKCFQTLNARTSLYPSGSSSISTQQQQHQQCEHVVQDSKSTTSQGAEAHISL